MPTAFKPHDYQRDAMEHIYSTRRCALWMPMGGGVFDTYWPHR